MILRSATTALLAACALVGCGDDGAGEAADAAPSGDARSPEFAYEVDALSRKPELRNRDDVQSDMERLYPRALQDAGIGGTVQTRFVIEPDGSVDVGTATVLGSDRAELSEASLKLIESFRFRPGQYQGEDVRVVVEMPITWQPAG